MQIESITHQGLRRYNNEDRFLVRVLDSDRAVLVIADGMGGHAAGEIAAELALESFKSYMPVRQDDITTELKALLKQSQALVISESMRDPSLRGMGTTLTALSLVGKSAFWVHVGDTRIYRFHDETLIRITQDHTIAGTLFSEGEITAEQARVHPYSNVLTKCLGCEDYEPDSGAFEVIDGDSILISTDGLHDQITEEQIAAVLSQKIGAVDKLNALVLACLDAGGKDNITALLAAF
jgi:serine/threonine protein phosphatase PrpC